MKKRLADVEAQRSQLNGDDDKTDDGGANAAIIAVGVTPAAGGIGGGGAARVASAAAGVDDAVAESDARSVYVGNVRFCEACNSVEREAKRCDTVRCGGGCEKETNILGTQVDYGATVEELGGHFSDCGTINRVTIMCNKATGMPKGFAYIEFAEESSVKLATILDGTEFRGRKIKVVAKRTNVPGMSYRGRKPRLRGRGFGRRGRRGFRGRWY